MAVQEVKQTTGSPAPSASMASSRRRTVSSSGARRSKGSVSTAGKTTVRTSSRTQAPASWNDPSGSGTRASSGRRARLASHAAKTGNALEGSPWASRLPMGAFHHASSRSRAGRPSSNSSRVCVIDFEPCKNAPSAPSRGVRRSAYHRVGSLKRIEPESSSAAAHRVPVRAKRIGARPRLDQLELRKPCPYLVGRNALRKKPATPLFGLPPERVQQIGRAGPRRPGDLARVCRLCRLRQGVEASLIKEKVEARIDRILVEPRNVAHEEHDRQLGGRRLGAGGADSPWHEIHTGHLPAAARHVDGGGPGAAAEIERPTGRQATSTLDDLDQLRWRDAAVPRRQP